MRLYILGFILLFLNACCGKVICDCWLKWHDAIGFQFVKLPLEGGFSAEEIDTLRLFRMDKNDVVLDSMELYKDIEKVDEYMTFDSTHYLLILGGWMGIYGESNKIDINQHHFRIKLLDGTTFEITDIDVQNDTYKINKCCECANNIKKTLKINGIDYDITGKEELGDIAIPLKH